MLEIICFNDNICLLTRKYSLSWGTRLITKGKEALENDKNFNIHKLVNFSTLKNILIHHSKNNYRNKLKYNKKKQRNYII